MPKAKTKVQILFIKDICPITCSLISFHCLMESYYVLCGGGGGGGVGLGGEGCGVVTFSMFFGMTH